AIRQAKMAYKRGDYPIGACIVRDGEIVAAAGNRVKTKGDSTKHIELVLIQYVVGMQHGPYISDCVLYTTHEPCPMCAGAAVWAKVGAIVYGNRIKDFQKHEATKKDYKWRTIDIPARAVVKGLGINVYGPFMNKECQKLFDLTKKHKTRS
ncbi:nucleoside deaminase, partial [Candidatus Falkowbacteria bacterium]|nr:nucleoside deaminase [Candidatus Falkowbacteria bacterium]